MKTLDEIKDERLLQGFVVVPPITDEEAAKLAIAVSGSTVTPEEIAKMKEALALIRQTDESYRQLSKALCGKENATLDEVLQAVSQAKAELEAVKRERDAAVKDMWFSAHCVNCKYRGKQENCDGTGCCYTCELDCPCAKFPCGYEWRGVCPENTNDDRSCLNCKHQGPEGRGICMDCNFSYSKHEPIENTEVQDDN